nr:DUF4962 domain-containing protein [Cytophagales bacterium]
MGDFKMKRHNYLSSAIFKKSYLKGLFSAILVSVFVGYMLLGYAKMLDREPAQNAPSTLAVVYPRYLDYPIPSTGMEVRTNPPIIRWPLSKGKDIRYDVRLSPEPDFTDPAKLVQETNLPWALFNPHRKLESGTWYWQVRQSGEQWSAVRHFTVDETAVEIVSPTADQFLKALPKGHPRVLAAATDLSLLRSLPSDEDSRAILLSADKYLMAPIPQETDGRANRQGEDKEQNRKLSLDASKELGTSVYNAILSLSEAFILTANDAYANKALEIAFEIADWDPKGVSSINDFGDARCMLAMALVYDTFFDRLSEAQKATLLSSIKTRAYHFYSSWVNNMEARVLSGHVWQHILHYFFQTCLALHGDDQDAATWMAYAYELFLARAPILGGMDGGWAEGVSYFRMNMETLIDIPLFIQKYTGFDFINSHPWYVHQIDWMLYHIPPGSSSDGFADNSEELPSPGPAYQSFALEIAKLTNSSKASWYANEVGKLERSPLSEEPTLRWVRLAKTRDLSVPKASLELKQPIGRMFNDIGLVALHSDMTDNSNNLMVAMRSSPFGSYGHMLSDQNVFNILYGGQKLFYRTGYKVSMNDPHRTGWYQHTKSQNGILVDGMGQPYSTEAYGIISRFLQGEDLAYAKGDASNAYSSKETSEYYGVVKNDRHLVLLTPNVILIYDDLAASKAVDWSWLIHSLEEMEIDTKDQTFAVDLENAVGKGRLWSSDNVFFHLSDTFAVSAVNWRETLDADGIPKSYDDSQYHLAATTLSKTSRMRFFAVIQVGKEVDESALLTGDFTNGTVSIKLGDWSIRAILDSDAAPGLQVQNTVTETAFSSHGDTLLIRNQPFLGSREGSSRLGIVKDDMPVFMEVIDQFPYDMQSRLRYFQMNQLPQPVGLSDSSLNQQAYD